MSIRRVILFFITIALFISIVSINALAQTNKVNNNNIIGAWRGQVQFNTGVFAGVKDLEFMYSFNSGGTMTESSNYDALPPVPPAYGIWKKVNARKYEAKYQFYQSKSLSSIDELIQNGGWIPYGYGTISQKITLSTDGNSFESNLSLKFFNQEGKPIAGGGEGLAQGKRIVF